MCSITAVAGLLLMAVGCSTVPERAEERAVLAAEVTEAVAAFKSRDPGIQKFFDESYGYAVLPKVTKGAWWIGGATGRGEVFEQGRKIGYCRMSQATIGFSFGGQFFREIIFFKSKTSLGQFRRGEFALAAQVKAVAATAGAAAKANYKEEMVVFALPQSGAMVDASIGGQKFKYVPYSSAD
jgi:lipid-binding SYLF domain-containing protein